MGGDPFSYDTVYAKKLPYNEIPEPAPLTQEEIENCRVVQNMLQYINMRRIEQWCERYDKWKRGA